MKQGRITGIVLAVANVILIIVCAVLFFRADRMAPRLEFQAVSVVYQEGMDQSELLAGITAYDRVDGDVTDRIVIEKMIEDTQHGSVVVFYAVSDKAGNVAKTSRVFQAVFGEQNADNYMEAGIDAALKLEQETASPESSGTDAISSPDPSEAVSTPSPEPSEAASTPSPEPSETVSTPSPEPVRTAAPENLPAPVPTTDPSVPVLTLNTGEVTVNAGQGPAWVDLIGTMTDDRDSYETLFGNLTVSRYDRNKAGTYQVTVFTEDSDGNRSKEVPLTIIVK